MRTETILLTALAATGLASGRAPAQHELFKLLSLDGSAGDYLGVSADIDGNRAVVGAWGDEDNGPASGSAYLFEVSTGQQLWKLLPGDGAPADGFGAVVAIQGSRAVIGAPYDNDWAADSGSAYVFDVDTGQELFKLNASDPEAGDEFGDAVALEGNLVVVGAPGEDTVAYAAGAAYVFDLLTGQELFKLMASDGAAQDFFGDAVAVSGRYVAAGALGVDPLNRGAVYVFDGTTGQELHKLVASDGAYYDGFGRYLAAHGDRLCISSRDAVYVFDLVTGQELWKLASSGAVGHDAFGLDLSIDGDLLVVGAPHTGILGTYEGSAYLFDVTTGQELFELLPSDGGNEDQFGHSVGLSGDRAIIGAFMDDTPGMDSGSAYVFDVSRRLIVTPAGPLESEGNPGGPFYPDVWGCTLHNTAAQAVDFLVTADVGWLDVVGGAGTIPAGEKALVDVSFGAAAGSLGLGTHHGTISFENVSTHEGDTTRAVELRVEEGLPQLIHRFALDTDPGWTCQSSWQFGKPKGGGGDVWGGPDPSRAYTGTNVFGFNLNGDYWNDMPMFSLTSGALDCSGSSGTTLRFWRWLNVESPSYDKASVQVSTDASSWTTVWQNPTSVYDSEWVQVEYDVSGVADGQSTVFLRWTMGPTDSVLECTGWNIDDVELWSDPPEPPGRGFCFGDPGYGIPCPCSNDNDGSLPGSGCANGVFASGAHLMATGVASVTGDTLVLRTTHAEPNNSGLYFQGTTDLTPGMVWGDGLRCTGGAIVRLQVRFADATGSSSTTTPIGAAGGVSAGDMRYYQLWYRTTDDPPCGSGVNDFNSSNGYVLTWQP